MPAAKHGDGRTDPIVIAKIPCGHVPQIGPRTNFRRLYNWIAGGDVISHELNLAVVVGRFKYIQFAQLVTIKIVELYDIDTPVRLLFNEIQMI